VARHRRLFNVAIEDDKTDTNPVRPQMFARENNQRVRYLTDEEEQRLREAIGEQHWPKAVVAIPASRTPPARGRAALGQVVAGQR